jgi:hypothetical protein
MIALYGDVRGGCIKVFDWPGSFRRYMAHYCSGEDGILLGVFGLGDTPDAAVRELWRRLHP